jgi:hypothetical protein
MIQTKPQIPIVPRRAGMEYLLNERRKYAGRRALLAIERASRLTAQDKEKEREQAFQWVRLWMAFAASRHVSNVTTIQRAA